MSEGELRIKLDRTLQEGSPRDKASLSAARFPKLYAFSASREEVVASSSGLSCICMVVMIRRPGAGSGSPSGLEHPEHVPCSWQLPAPRQAGLPYRNGLS